MALAEGFEGVLEDGAGVVVVEVGETVVATEGDEVVVTEVVVALQTARHLPRVHDWVPRSWTLFVHERVCGVVRVDGYGGCRKNASCGPHALRPS